MKFSIVMNDPQYFDYLRQDISMDGWMVDGNIFTIDIQGIDEENMGLKSMVAGTLYGFFTRLKNSNISLPPENAGYVECPSGNRYTLQIVANLFSR